MPVCFQSTLPVSLQLEIAPQHHLFIIGRAGANIKQIMQRTGANILFPDPNTVQTQRKGTVYVTGHIESVFVARQHLIVSAKCAVKHSAEFAVISFKARCSVITVLSVCSHDTYRRCVKWRNCMIFSWQFQTLSALFVECENMFFLVSDFFNVHGCM